MTSGATSGATAAGRAGAVRSASGEATRGAAGSWHAARATAAAGVSSSFFIFRGGERGRREEGSLRRRRGGGLRRGESANGGALGFSVLRGGHTVGQAAARDVRCPTALFARSAPPGRRSRATRPPGPGCQLGTDGKPRATRSTPEPHAPTGACGFRHDRRAAMYGGPRLGTRVDRTNTEGAKTTTRESPSVRDALVLGVGR